MRWIFFVALCTPVTAVAVLASSCQCGAPDEPRPASEAPSRGEERAVDHGLATAIGEPIDLTGVSDFEPIDLELAGRAERARSWGRRTGLGDRDAASRASVGNWLCRLETHFGPPPEVTGAGFRYALRERATGYVITAFADASGPALGGVLHDEERPVDLEQLSALVDRFARLMDATTPEPCSLIVGARTVGVEDGEWFERAAE